MNPPTQNPSKHYWFGLLHMMPKFASLARRQVLTDNSWVIGLIEKVTLPSHIFHMAFFSSANTIADSNGILI
jgi:hypothetical protein